MNKNLIVYFSHRHENYVSGKIVDLKVGNTKVIVQKISKLLACDMFEIEPLHDYPFKYQECTELAKKELHNDERPKITNLVSHIEKYENIILAYPNWWSTMPMCIWTFLESYDLSNKHIYPLCSHEGSGLGRSVSDIKKLCPNSIIHDGLAIKGSEALDCDNQLEAWVKEIG